MFKALLLEKDDAGFRAAVRGVDEAGLPEGDVTVARRVLDAQLQGRAGDHRQSRRSCAGGRWCRHRRRRHRARVEPSGWKAGDRVVLNGWGVGETHWGGLARAGATEGRLAGARCRRRFSRARRWRSAPPATPRCCAVMALERHGVKPGDGPVLVTGASGGVGSVAIALLARLGYQVAAATGRPQEADYLRELGAARDRRSRRAHRARQAAAEGALGRGGRRRRQPHAGQRAARRRATAASSRPAAWPRASTCRRPSCPSSCAA